MVRMTLNPFDRETSNKTIVKKKQFEDKHNRKKMVNKPNKNTQIDHKDRTKQETRNDSDLRREDNYRPNKTRTNKTQKLTSKEG
jgi:hypothetical protein